jgi:hypothetical protein
MHARRRLALALGPLAVAATIAAAPAGAAACTCAEPGKADVKTSFAGAALVTVARVDAHEFIGDVGWRTRVTALRTYKGGDAERFEITAAKTCGFAFEVGERYLVYAYSDGDTGYTTTYCSRTVQLAAAAEDLAALGRIVQTPIIDHRAAPLLALALGGWSSNPVVQGLRIVAMLMHAAG